MLLSTHARACNKSRLIKSFDVFLPVSALHYAAINTFAHSWQSSPHDGGPGHQGRSARNYLPVQPVAAPSPYSTLGSCLLLNVSCFA